MVTITDEELLARARVLFSKLGGMKSQDARLVRALIERAGLGRQPTPRAADGEECNGCEYNPCDLENNSDYCPARR